MRRTPCGRGLLKYSVSNVNKIFAVQSAVVGLPSPPYGGFQKSASSARQANFHNVAGIPYYVKCLVALVHGIMPKGQAVCLDAVRSAWKGDRIVQYPLHLRLIEEVEHG